VVIGLDPLKPLTDRALQGRYSPGSTFKMAVAAAALEEGVITPDFQVTCRGAGVFNGNVHKCWKPGGHGTLDLRHAIEGSCNVYFYTIGNMTGVDRIHKWATAFGLRNKAESTCRTNCRHRALYGMKRRTTGEVVCG
jgi:penicillin-binding protein 2